MIIDAANLTLADGVYTNWVKDLEIGRTIEFSMRSNDTVHVAILSSAGYNGFEADNQMDLAEKSVLETTSVNFTHQIISSGTYYFVVYNYHETLTELEHRNVSIHSVSVIEEWTEEQIENTIERRTRTETALVTVWQFVMGAIPVY